MVSDSLGGGVLSWEAERLVRRFVIVLGRDVGLFNFSGGEKKYKDIQEVRLILFGDIESEE